MKPAHFFYGLTPDKRQSASGLPPQSSARMYIMGNNDKLDKDIADWIKTQQEEEETKYNAWVQRAEEEGLFAN